MIRLKYVLFVFLLCTFAFPTAENQAIKEMFTSAKKHYKAGNYNETITIIRGYLKKHGREQSTEHIVPLLMEALIRENNIAYFKKLLSIYKRKFADSRYIPRLIYLDGIVKAREQNYKKSVISFSNAMNKGLSKTLDSLAVLNVIKICKTGATLNELASLSRNSSLNYRISEAINYYILIKLYKSGQAAKAKKLAERFRKKYPRSTFNSNVRKIISKSKVHQKNTMQIGLLAPISGENSDIGKFVVQGVQLAVDSYNKRNTPKIELVILDTRGSMVETAKKVREMINVHRIQIIIGPVLSANATVAASAIMDNRDVVMITPTATDDGIAKLGVNIFQMNVTLGILGKRIARYAINTMNIREFAILTPLTEYGSILSDNFREEVMRLGGEITAQEHFDEGANDYRIQFESLRSKLAERKWEQMALEGRPEYGENARDRRSKDRYLADSTIEIGGLFIPAESEDACKIASQVYFHRIRTQLLGSNGWHTNSTILGGKRYVNNAVISTNFETDALNENWKSFSKLFWERFKENPDRVAAPLGYDAASLVLDAMKTGDDADAIIDYLKDVLNYKGVSGAVSFDNPDGVNSKAAILKISNKKFIRLE